MTAVPRYALTTSPPYLPWGDAYVLSQRRGRYYAVCCHCHHVAAWATWQPDGRRLLTFLDLAGEAFPRGQLIPCGTCGRMQPPVVTMRELPGWRDPNERRGND